MIIIFGVMILNGKKTNGWSTIQNSCVGITKSSSNIRSDGRCVSSYDNANCHTGYCCSKYGYCGKSKDHCGSGCQGKFDKCS